MKLHSIVSVVLLLAISACEDNGSNNIPDPKSSTNEIRLDQQSFDQSWASLQDGDPISDPFWLKGLRNNGTTLVIDVSYSGGCEAHDFELIWPEVITMIYPPRYTVILNHNANGDMCEAYLSDTLLFDLSKYSLGLTPDIMDLIDLTIINGSNGDESLNLNN